MLRYRRNFVPGGTFSFTVTLADRRSSALVDHVDALRAAFRAGRRERPFTVDAIVPKHVDDWAGNLSGVEPNCRERVETQI